MPEGQGPRAGGRGPCFSLPAGSTRKRKLIVNNCRVSGISASPNLISWGSPDSASTSASVSILHVALQSFLASCPTAVRVDVHIRVHQYHYLPTYSVTHTQATYTKRRNFYPCLRSLLIISRNCTVHTIHISIYLYMYIYIDIYHRSRRAEFYSHCVAF